MHWSRLESCHLIVRSRCTSLRHRCHATGSIIVDSIQHHARDEENLSSCGRIIEIIDGFPRFVNGAPRFLLTHQHLSIDIFSLFSQFGIVILKKPSRQGEKELQTGVENLMMCVPAPSNNDNLGDRHVNLVHQRSLIGYPFVPILPRPKIYPICKPIL